MTRFLTLALTLATAAGHASAQSHSVTPGFDSLGTGCGLALHGQPIGHDGTVDFSITGATPRAPMLLVVGSQRADLPLPHSKCRLATVPVVTVSLQARADGTATVNVRLPQDTEQLIAQAVELGAAGRTSGGLAITMTSTERENTERIARLDLADGNFIEFLKLDDSELLVVGSGSEQSNDVTDRFLAGEVSAVQLYERLSGQRAPTTLRDAEAAAVAARDRAPQHAALETGAGPGRGTPPEQEPDGSCYSTSWFVQNACEFYSGWFSYCWTNLYGDPWVQRRCFTMTGRTACVSGSYVFEYRRNTWLGWRTSFSTSVHSCQYFWARGTGDTRSRRMHVKYGSGDHKHFAVFGF